jgi:hypothetical protein
LANRRRFLFARLAAWRHLVVQVKMRGAAVLTLSTVPRVNAALDTFTGHVNVCPLMSCLILHISESATGITFLVLPPIVVGPLSFEINLNADVITLLVHLLTILVEAVLRTASVKQRLSVGLFEENIDIAFNLLCGRPINLSILLKALLDLVGSFPLRLTASPTPVVVVIAVQEVASFPPAIGRLTFCLSTIALSIQLDIGMVGLCALLVQLSPLAKRNLKGGNLLLEPRAKGSIHIKSCNVCRTKSTAVPGGVGQQTTLLLSFRAIVRCERCNVVIQCPAFGDVLFVFVKEFVTAFLMS